MFASIVSSRCTEKTRQKRGKSYARRKRISGISTDDTSTFNWQGSAHTNCINARMNQLNSYLRSNCCALPLHIQRRRKCVLFKLSCFGTLCASYLTFHIHFPISSTRTGSHLFPCIQSARISLADRKKLHSEKRETNGFAAQQKVDQRKRA